MPKANTKSHNCFDVKRTKFSHCKLRFEFSHLYVKFGFIQLLFYLPKHCTHDTKKSLKKRQSGDKAAYAQLKELFMRNKRP